MTASSDCLSDTELDALASSNTDQGPDPQWVAHLDTCTACQRRLAQLSSAFLAADVTELKEQSSKASALREVEQRLKRDRSEPVTAGPQWSEAELANIRAVLQSDFDAVEPIGRGGMGIVYRARQQSLQRLVAVKVLSPRLADEASARERFVREARSAAAIKHSNVVAIHAISADTFPPYIVMEYIRGHSLQEELDAGRKPTLENVIRMGRQLASALAAAHKQGVVHRDVKPGNILLDLDAKKVMLGDFGLAIGQHHSRLTHSGTIVGTPAFLAPEALQPELTVDHRADLFSLGAVLYALCAGQSPFQGDSLLATIRQVSAAEPRQLNACNPEVPAWLSEVVMKLLAKEPQHRYQSAEEVRVALSSPAAEQDVNHVGSDKLHSPTLTRANHHNADLGSNYRLWAAVTIAMLLILIPAAVLYFNQGRQATDHQSSASLAGAGKDEDRAITLLDQDANVLGRYRSLINAVENASDDQEILIASNEAMEISESLVFDADISLRAADGFSPTLEFYPHVADDAETFCVVESKVTLAGLELVVPGADEHYPAAISVQEDGELLLDNCHVVIEQDGVCIAGESSNSVQIVDSLLHAPHATATMANLESGETVFRGSRVIGTVGLELVSDISQNVVILDSKFICDSVLAIDRDEFDDRSPTHEVRAERSLIYALEAFMSQEADETDDVDDIDTVSISNLRWSGNQNTYGGQVAKSEWFEGASLGWEAFLEQEDSHYQRDPLGFALELLEDLDPSDLEFAPR